MIGRTFINDTELGCVMGDCGAANALKGDAAQATIEAAFVLPVLMLLFLMLLQPGVYLYDRMVMSNAAAEGCRLLATSSTEDRQTCEDFVRRRLSAIPQTDIFHIHRNGCSYSIEFDGSESSETVSVKITNRIKPLPLLDMTMAFAGLSDSSGSIGITVEATSPTQPEWVRASADGTDPEGWTES